MKHELEQEAGAEFVWPRWIRTDERLPEKYGNYLVFIVHERQYWEDTFPDNQTRISKKQVHLWTEIRILTDFNVDEGRITHWLPLPDRPEVL